MSVSDVRDISQLLANGKGTPDNIIRVLTAGPLRSAPASAGIRWHTSRMHGWHARSGAFGTKDQTMTNPVPTKPITETDVLLMNQDEHLSTIHRSLLVSARDLSERMARLVRKLELEGLDTTVNGFGEVQGLGADVDRYCALLGEAQRQRALARRLVEAAQRDR
ncbi:MAG: hypothetical protein DIU78_019515 [Pseudomonadota bacterium]|jgi:hypothetical protein